ncbi:MAG: MvaI/BcnI family restriction endonuclease, partial [Pyrinomonadaceae bacterium]
LLQIYHKGWIRAKRLQKDGTIVECRGQNCGGYTLEAELGIPPNSYSEPDFMGWEVKQHGVSGFDNLMRKIQAGVITLMTPEPTAGFYRDRGVIDFVLRFGYQDKMDREDRYNFGGVHKAGMRHPSTNLTLTLDGYDTASGKITDANGGITLYSEAGESAATWLFADLMTHWNRKHAQAVYVPSIRQQAGELNEYHYGMLVRMGEGTDFLRFLKCVAEGIVYYDPGIRVENASTNPTPKRRNQFRVKSREIGNLYSRLTVENLL